MDPFAALADPVRRRVVELLDGEARTAGRLATAFPAISRPAVSRHLRVLREAGLVEAELVGRERVYRLRPDGLDAVRSWLGGIGSTADAARSWEHRLDALATEVHRTRRQRERDERAAAPQPDRPAEPDHPEQEQTA